MAKALRKSTPAPAPTGKIVDAGKITMAGKGGLAVGTDRMRPVKNNSDIGIRRGRRATPKDLYREEAEQRLKVGRATRKLEVFAGDLHHWFKVTYPKRKPPAAIMIQRNIGDLWRRYRG